MRRMSEESAQRRGTLTANSPSTAIDEQLVSAIVTDKPHWHCFIASDKTPSTTKMKTSLERLAVDKYYLCCFL